MIGPKAPASASDNNGGHAHADPKASPPESRPIGTLRFNGATSRTVDAVVNAKTECAQPVDHLTPVYAGKASAELLVTLPDGWHTVYPEPLDDSRKSWKYLETFDIAHPGLAALPASGDGSYVKSRKSDRNHVDADAFSINAEARDYLEALIWYYKYASNRALSINDISLPKGGHFDIGGEWSGSHYEHRFGTEVDINQSAILPCHENYWIRGLMRGLMPTRTMALPQPTRLGWTRFGRLLCEEDKIHLNLEVMPIDP